MCNFYYKNNKIKKHIVIELKRSNKTTVITKKIFFFHNKVNKQQQNKIVCELLRALCSLFVDLCAIN